MLNIYRFDFLCHFLHFDAKYCNFDAINTKFSANSR